MILNYNQPDYIDKVFQISYGAVGVSAHRILTYSPNKSSFVMGRYAEFNNFNLI